MNAYTEFLFSPLLLKTPLSTPSLKSLVAVAEEMSLNMSI